MPEPRPVTETDAESFAWTNAPVKVSFGKPRDSPSFEDTQSVDVLWGMDERSRIVTRIPFKPTEDEVIELSRGGTIWLTLWTGQMPPVDLAVTDAKGNVA